ncbi:MAG: SCP2 sterol-binding domain-containing protein [Pseudomonadota bacterium]
MSLTPDRRTLMGAAGDAFETGFDGIIEIQADDLDPFFIDGRGARCAIADEAPAASDMIWRSSPTTLLSVFQRKRAFENAYLSGRLTISGDMSVMARLALKGD